MQKKSIFTLAFLILILFFLFGCTLPAGDKLQGIWESSGGALGGKKVLTIGGTGYLSLETFINKPFNAGVAKINDSGFMDFYYKILDDTHIELRPANPIMGGKFTVDYILVNPTELHFWGTTYYRTDIINIPPTDLNSEVPKNLLSLNLQNCTPNFITNIKDNLLIYQSDITYSGETGNRVYYTNSTMVKVFGKIDESRCFLQFYNVSVPSLPKGQQTYQILDCIFDTTKGTSIECNAVNSLEITSKNFD